ncbi:MAG: carboxy terminal-processing peptidase [Methyloversatilis sp.]|uniref:carboxy terminal-processing peptidase n=1 Tax=Methyloversatilis sp. TaxID=2569862 RepID=UPI0027329A17|nr:carboxy terminal-processing peptidase [Methyloversatilis sp.]MDP3872698.1 carboxy terminal-processing peptidase [Methyloversatilis sp.]
MKLKTFWIVFALATSAQAASTATMAPPLRPVEAHALAAQASAELLSRFHYQNVPLDDALSVKIFDRYLKTLDPERIYFLQSDIDTFGAVRTLLDDAILQQRLEAPFAIFTRYSQRVRERLADARVLLAGGFDFSKPDSYRYVRTDVPWASSEAELKEIWRKRVKNDWLRLKLAGKDDAAIRDTLTKRYDLAMAHTARSKSDDVFQLFMNAYAESIEPHTSYLGPRASADFAITMKLSLVGIGAVLQERDEYVTIRELVPGGPAARSEQLAIGDRIAGVAKDENAPMADVLGWRVDDVVQLIRGNKDTKVVLDVLPADAGPDGKHKRITLVRDTIRLEKQAAAKSVIEVGGDVKQKVGVITLPTFYQDVDARHKNDENYRSASRDVAKLLAELKAENVGAVLIDLRNNGGGSLDESVRLTGLFIDRGPVVQQRNPKGQVRIEQDRDPGVAWDGPVGVLINRASASASEIFASAIQDYGRGIVIGEQSFGKGTVQTLLDMDEMAKSEKPTYGELKLTVAQFFRVSGGTTQLRGVTPDIPLASFADRERFGESSYDNALPWTQIEPADFKPVGSTRELLPALTTRHSVRVANDAGYRELLEDIAEVEAIRKRTEISLNEKERRKEREAQEARLKARSLSKAAVDGDTDGPALPRDDGLQAGERSLSAELAAEKSRKAARDVLLEEAAHIMGDMASLTKSGTELARNGKATAGVAPAQ